MGIKATCRQPAEHACIINHVCGFLLYRKKMYCPGSKRKGHQRGKKMDTEGAIFLPKWAEIYKQIQALLVVCKCASVTKKHNFHNLWPPKLDEYSCFVFFWELFLCSSSLPFPLFFVVSAKDKKFLVWAWRLISKDTCGVKWFASPSELLSLLLGSEKNEQMNGSSRGLWAEECKNKRGRFFLRQYLQTRGFSRIKRNKSKIAGVSNAAGTEVLLSWQVVG